MTLPFIQRLLFKIILAFLFELACRPIKRIYILIIWNVQTLAAGQKNFCQPEMYCPLNYRIFTNCPHKNDMWICEEILPGTKQNFTRFPIQIKKFKTRYSIISKKSAQGYAKSKENDKTQVIGKIYRKKRQFSCRQFIIY